MVPWRPIIIIIIIIIIISLAERRADVGTVPTRRSSQSVPAQMWAAQISASPGGEPPFLARVGQP